MNTISFEVAKLLERLYNLKGSESTILSKIDNEKEELLSRQKSGVNKKANLEESIKDCQRTIDTLSKESEKLYALLSNIKVDEYQTVLNMLELEFEPNVLKSQFEEKYPELIETFNKELEENQSELIVVETELEEISLRLEELSLSREEALNNQNKLNEYFELALSGNDNLTRESINSLLGKFDFNDSEKRLAAKILMFPEDALFEYDERLKEEEKKGISIGDVLSEAKENSHIEFADNDEIDEVAEENEIEEETKPVIEENNSFEINPLLFNDEEEVREEVVEKESSKEIIDDKDEIKETLEEIGLDPLDFNVEKLDMIKDNFNQELIVRNVLFAKENNIDLDLFVENVGLMYDPEFVNKVVCLLDLGKTPFDIYLSPNVLIKYDYRELKNAISLLVTSGLDPKQVPLMAF